MLAGASRGFRRKMSDAVRLINSTGLRLAGVDAEWARFSTSVFGAKAHVKANTPLNMPREMPLEPGSTVLGDRIAFLAARQAMNRKNPMPDGLREIVVRTETARRYASSPTISTRPLRRLRICTSAAGGSSCSSA